uniref:Disease resistance R13L4/SHOC-2-like LRR domain-containing protein n=1 Tax=Oryza rufipogon TaxID=4529 RepID=A0A0E0RBN6_ORYRU
MAQRLSIQKEIEEKKTDLTSSYGIMELLVPTKRSVPYPLHLLNVLDLEGCRGLKKKHLKIICKKVSHLRYLGLKDTDIPCLPKHIHKLQQLETLDIRKTKVRESNMKYLFNQIEKMDKCLRSLSIWIEGPSNDDHADDPMLSLLSPPKFLQSLSISGTGALLTRWIGKLGQLSKLSLRETCLSDNDFVILGNLGCLCYLRLRYVSFEGSVLTFTNGAFMNLIILDIEDKEIRKLIFQYGATPKLEKLVWSCKCMESPEGLEDLQSLREFELNGVSQDIGIMQKDSIELCSFQDGGNGSKEKMLHKALNRKGGERIPSKKKIPFRNKVWQKIQFKL